MDTPRIDEEHQHAMPARARSCAVYHERADTDVRSAM
jgi:hypothetical protein